MSNLTPAPAAGGSNLNRRTLLGAGTAALAGVAMPTVLRAQGLRKVTFTLAFIPQGSSLYTNVAQAKGFWRKRGLDVEIASNQGSLASAQAVGTGRFQFGLVQIPTVILNVAKGLPIVAVGLPSYRVGTGLLMLRSSDIKKPGQLEGRKLGFAGGHGATILFPLYCKRMGIDEKSIQGTQIDQKVLDAALEQQRVDAITVVATSNMPVFLSKNVPVRYFGFDEVGLDLYGLSLVTQKEIAEKDPELVQAVVDGLFEGVAYSLTNPDESLDIFIKAVPELALTANGKEYSRYGFGMYAVTALAEEARRLGLGAIDAKKLDGQIDLVTEYMAPAGTSRPETAAVFNPAFAGRIKLSDAQWASANAFASPFARFLTNEG